jgi:hypothetical protein
VCGLPQMCVCHIITGDKNRPVVKVLFPLHISVLKCNTNVWLKNYIFIALSFFR